MVDSLVKSLQKIISGTVTDQHEILKFYSVDSSSFVKQPKLVVIPENIDDVKKTVKFSIKRKIPIAARGGSTGLVGSSLTNGIVIDMRNFNKIKLAKNHVVVGAGTSKGELDKFLGTHKKFFGANPSVGAYCKIGGMIATNASGTKSLKYGSTIDNILEITFIDGLGNQITLPNNKNVSNKIGHISYDAGKYFPNVSKNSCGYRLDLIDYKNTQRIIAGSESTLGIIVEAKLRINNSPKKQQLTIIGFETLEDATYTIPYILPLHPSSLELIDHSIMKNIPYKFSKKLECLLMVELDESITKSCNRLEYILHDYHAVIKTTTKSEIKKWWAYRDSALYFTLKNIPNANLLPHVIEDVAVPPENLKFLITILKKITKKHNLKFVIYGHAGNGNLHIRLISNKKRNFDKLYAEFFSIVIALGGTITGEHGDGIARTKFLQLQYPKKLLQKFYQIKKEFDPYGILNPGKII